MNPWRAYLLLLQDLARWIGTREGMISSDLHRGLKPTDGCCNPNQGQEDIKDLHQEERRKSPWRHPGRPRPMGILLFHMDVGL
jgi:hypothetical protein